MRRCTTLRIWAVDGAAAYDEGEGDEKMNEGY